MNSTLITSDYASPSSLHDISVSYHNGQQVMSSVDLAVLCVGDSKDAHSDFMKKAKKVLGDVGKFSDISKDSYGRNRNILLLPERESCLMAMSYSYELQAQVYDRWKALETGAAKPAASGEHKPIAPVFKDNLELAELFGITGNQAKLSASRATEKLIGINPAVLIDVELKSDIKEKTFTPTALGKEFLNNLSGLKVNKLLEGKGLQERIDSQWELTEAGKKYAEVIDTGKKRSSGTPVKQIKWYKSAVSALKA